MCGENYAIVHTGLRGFGSPPRVRGKRLADKNADLGQRITPACAGKTKLLFCVEKCLTDHPRVCGENAHNAEILLKLLGSPPRVRGKLSR